MEITYKNLYFDYGAFLILTILLISTIARKMIKGKMNRSFFELLIIVLLAIVFDIWAVSLDNQMTADSVSQYIAHTGYLTLHSVMMPFYLTYIIALTDSWHLFKQKRLAGMILFFPELCMLVMLLTNSFHHLIFYVDGYGRYCRGEYFILLYVCAGIYLFYGLAYLVVQRKLFRFRHIVLLNVVFAVVALGVILQYFRPDLLIEMFCVSVGLMLISLLLQRPEERLDVVTGLNKITAYMEDMKQAFYTKKPMRVIMVNITNYSSVMELLGYEKGMRTMKGVAQYMLQLDKEKRLNAELYYLESGKFRFVVEEKNFDKVWETAVEMNALMQKNIVINKMAVNMITNVCITDCPEDISDVDTLMAFGDTLHQVAYTGEVMAAVDLLKHMNYDLMRDMDAVIDAALVNHGFSVFYQPIFSVEEQRFNSAEALLRLQDKTYGFVSPDLFIPAAEKSGAIHKIGDYVLEEVCQFISSPDYENLGLEYIEVNLSVVQCMQPHLAKHVMDILNRYGVKPEQLNLEITETAASISQQALEENIEELTEQGIRFSLDDYGTGYSNMQRIVRLPLDIIKLDRTFTELYDNPKLGIVLKNTIEMIKAMDMKIVVEGVETEEMLKLFSAMQCEYIQGYYFSKPIPREKFVEFIQASL